MAMIFLRLLHKIILKVERNPDKANRHICIYTLLWMALLPLPYAKWKWFPWKKSKKKAIVFLREHYCLQYFQWAPSGEPTGSLEV